MECSAMRYKTASNSTGIETRIICIGPMAVVFAFDNRMVVDVGTIQLHSFLDETMLENFK